MFYGNKGVIQLHGKPIDILVDLTLLFEDLLKDTPEEIRGCMLHAIKSSADMAMEMVKADEGDKKTDDDVLSELLAKAVNFNESEEE